MKKSSSTGDVMDAMHLLRRLARETRGAALIEFSITAPLLLALMCGVAEFANALREYHVMAKGVRDAARYLTAVPASPPCLAADANWATAVSQAKNLAVFGSTSGGTALFRTWTSVSTVSVDASTCLANPRNTNPTVLANPLPRIRVTASAPYADLGMFGLLGLTPPTLTASHEELRVS